ncbi:type II CRISPR RNA-guided endonuclease Cas9, partial [Candidatus Saccharibacteria bacterium]|nr:type II CRISPR RNA-guided endonuclease Cas9 [Candidatus Saccharibacteria bacterium]
MKYSLGLDIGVASIGWAVINLDRKRIEDLGVRVFEKPENPKDGRSLAEPRRTARSARRRLRRRRQRLNYLKRFFVENGLLTGERIEEILTPRGNAKNPYELREKGLKEKLENDELFVALYHIAKRRGYKSNRKSVEEEDKKGAGKVLESTSENRKLLTKYETVAVALNADGKFAKNKRNKADNYSNSFIRENFLAEIEAILKEQQKHYEELTNERVEGLLGRGKDTDYKGLFDQRPFMTQELIEKMCGICPLEKDQPRAHKASLTFEMFRLAQDLAHLTYNSGKQLTEEEVQKCVERCKDTATVKYKHIREVLGYKNDTNFTFDYIRGKDPKKEDLEKNLFAKEDNDFTRLKFYQAVKKALKEFPDEWGRVEADEDLFDNIGYVFTANKDDEAIMAGLKEFGGLSDGAVGALVSMKESFSGFGHLSVRALRKITPFVLRGNTYDKAIEMAGYSFGQKLSGEKNKLPPLNEDEAHQLTNPVVKRAVSQTIKVVNAVIRKYGAPTRVSIECANELAKNFKDRSDIKKAQDENAERNEKIVGRLKSEFNVVDPTGLQISKFKLYNDQDGKCLYCGKPMALAQLFSDEHYGEIDHIIPFSYCGNDSRGNKVLVHNECNQNKRNMMPYEAWGNDEDRWAKFEVLVNSNPKIPYAKKQRLLAKTRPKEDWNSRALNDTRYITRFMSRF